MFLKTITEMSRFCLVFVAPDLIEKIYSREEFKAKLKLELHWHHVETMIQNFE